MEMPTVNIMDRLPLEPGAFYLMDRGYLDFARLFVIHQAKAFFVTRAKRNTQFQRRYSHPVSSDQYNGISAIKQVADEIPGQHGLPREHCADVVVKDDKGKRLVHVLTLYNSR